MTSIPHKEFEARAIKAGVNTNLAHSMSNVVRDSQAHDWMPLIQDWAANENAMINLALNEPETMVEACRLLVSSDGLMHDEGPREAGIPDTRRSELEAWIFTEDLRKNHVQRPWGT